jgi:2-amino-4-hydroxy-6-hydroxymethyldihydropteridine diphosphokinase
VRELSRRGRLISVSSVYETEPMYRADQEWFLNGVVVLETSEGPVELLRRMKETEERLGRRRRRNGERNAPREIDLDLLLYGDAVLSTGELQVPHPRIAERAFVLAPLAEVRPGARHPVTGETARELLERVGDGYKVVRVARASSLRPRRRARRAGSQPRRGSAPGTRRSPRPAR